MRDFEIRPILLEFLDGKHGKDSNTRIIEEFGLCQGNARVDVAVINGSIHGYEIKSEKDTLKRLPVQKEYYNRTLDFVTLICEETHLEKAKEIIPHWWGIYKIKMCGKEKESLEKIRSPQKNPSLDIEAVIQLLWKDEALDVLKAHKLARGMGNKKRSYIWKKLMDSISEERLKSIIRKKLINRKNWKG